MPTNTVGSVGSDGRNSKAIQSIPSCLLDACRRLLNTGQQEPTAEFPTYSYAIYRAIQIPHSICCHVVSVLVAGRRMDLKGLWALCVLTLLICTLPQSTAQCSLDLGGPFTSIPGVPFQEIFSEFSPSSFVLDELTYLCYSRSETNSDTFSEIRVSVLYRYQSVGGTLQLTLDCNAGLGRWVYDRTRPSLDELSADQHIAENMTREGCANCRDNSTKSFGDPTYCSRE